MPWTRSTPSWWARSRHRRASRRSRRRPTWARKLWQHLKDPFYDRGTNDKGIGMQLAYSIGRVLLGFLLAVLVAIPLGFLIGMSPLDVAARSTRSSRC